uniref:Uncharacterized protein n=1 Tax=Aureoumbra lagunensis TaxID=44058 RepID=A0A7S3JY53_9STRA
MKPKVRMSVSSATSTTIRRCRCGSASHSRVTHHSCPLNPKKNNSEEFVPPPKVSENAENVPPPSQSNEKSTLNKEESVPSEQNDEGSKLATKQEEQKRKKLTQLRSASTKRTVEIDASTLPRISAESTSLTALKAEAKARGGIPPGYSRCSRKTLLEELGIGSILLSGTREFRFVERVKALMDREKKC